MKIALITQYFWPESFSINELVKELAAQGHQIDVYTGKPNYPDGQVFSGYRAEGTSQEEFAPGVSVFRAPLTPRGKGGGKALIKNYLSFVWNGLRHFPGQAKDKDYDVIFVFSLSPITAALPAIRLKRQKKVPMVMWVLDLWPESLSATGFIKNRAVLFAVSTLVRYIYSHADRILVQSKPFINAVSKYADRRKIQYFPNFSADIAALAPDAPTAVPTDILAQVENHFSIVFAGNLGTAQAVETLVAAAGMLEDLTDFRLVLVGSGSMSAWLAQAVAQGSSNVILAGRYPSDEMPHFFRRAQGLLVSLKDEPIYAQTIPAKIQSYLAAGKPIVASLNGAGADVVLEAGAGLASPAEDAAALSGNIRKLYQMSQTERQQMGTAARNYFLQHFELTQQARRLVEHLSTESRDRSK